MLAIPIIILALAAVFLLLCHFFYRIAFRRNSDSSSILRSDSAAAPHAPYKDAISAGIHFIDAQPFEPLTITSRDGIELAGKYYQVENENALILLFHGYRSSARKDFSCVAESFLKDGKSLLMVDQRAHGLSGGKTITLGVLERYDCLDWANYATKRFGKKLPIFLEGISMGAATVLSASAFNLPENVAGIIADCGFTSAEDVTKGYIKKRHYPVRLVWPFVLFGARLFGGFDPLASSSETALKQCRVPVLLIHGESDGLVPCEMSRRNCAACPDNAILVTVPDANHCLSYVVDQEKVQTALTDFFNTNMPVQNSDI